MRKYYLIIQSNSLRANVFNNEYVGELWSTKMSELTSYLAHWGTHSLYPSPNMVSMIKSSRLGWVGHVARIKEVRNTFKILTGKSTGKIPLGRPGHR